MLTFSDAASAYNGDESVPMTDVISICDGWCPAIPSWLYDMPYVFVTADTPSGQTLVVIYNIHSRFNDGICSGKFAMSEVRGHRRQCMTGLITMHEWSGSQDASAQIECEYKPDIFVPTIGDCLTNINFQKLRVCSLRRINSLHQLTSELVRPLFGSHRMN